MMIFGAERAVSGSVRGVMASALLATTTLGAGAIFASGTAHAQAAQSYDIPAGPLAVVLNRFAETSGIKLFYGAPLTSGLSSPGLKGSYGSAEGLSRILTGSGLTYRQTGTDAFTLERAPQVSDGSIQLGPVRVEGEAQPAGASAASTDAVITEGSGSYAVTAVTLGKLPQSLREVPRSISVITRTQMDDQRIATLNDAIEQLPGVTLTPPDGWGSGGYFARGFEITSFLVDGSQTKGKTEGDMSFNTSMSKYDSVQFLHGPDGLFSGSGQPSGTINLVRKRPTDQLQLKVAASAGSWNNYLGEADVSGPLTSSGAIKGRFVVAYNDAEKFYDYAHRKSTTLYGILSFALDPKTTLSTGASHDRNAGQGQDYATAFPRYSDGELLPIPRSLGLPPISFMNNEVQNYFVELRHELNDKWAFRANASKTDTKILTFLPYYNGAVDPLTGTGTRFFSFPEQYDGKVRSRAFDANLSGNFDALGRHHRVMFGADYLRTHSTGAISSVQGIANVPVDLLTFDPGTFTNYVIAPAASFRDNLKEQKSIYGYGDFQIYGPVHLILGGRYTNYKNLDNRYRTGRPIVPVYSRDSGYFLPYYALVYDFASDWSVYATNARSFEDQSNRYDENQKPLGPTKGRSYEVGIKGEHFGGRLNSNITVYLTERTNFAVKTSDDPSFDTIGGTCCYSGDGEFRAQGVEFQLSGEVAKGLQVNGGYTFDDNKTHYGATSGQRFNTATPKHILRMWAAYRLPGRWSDLKLGGGVRVQSRYFREGTVNTWNPVGGPAKTGAFDGPPMPFRFTDPGRALWNVFADYAVTSKVTAAINVNNVFDKRYLAAVGSTAGGNIYGEPRSVFVTLRGTF